MLARVDSTLDVSDDEWNNLRIYSVTKLHRISAQNVYITRISYACPVKYNFLLMPYIAGYVVIVT